MTFLDSDEIYKWVKAKGMSELHARELHRCIEVAIIIDEDVERWKNNH
jgi:hypothetical protein